MNRTLRVLAPLVLVFCGLRHGAGVQLTPEQQQAVDKLKAKGGSVMQLAADSDSLVVNLGLAGKAVGDDELALVKTLPKIVELDLHGTGVTDAGLANVEGLTTLTHLRLDRTQISDAGLAHLKGLTNLVYLNLYETPVTDAGLETLKGMKGLKRIYLWQTKVTDGGADALRKALPDAAVNRGEGMAALAAVPPPPPPAPASAAKVDDKTGKKPDKTAKKPGDKVAAKPGAGDLKPDDKGFIRAWLLLAPIQLASQNDGGTEIDKEQLPGEKDLKPQEGDKAKAGDKELTWKAVKAADYFFDVNDVLGQPNDNSAAYAVAYIDSADEKKDLVLLMGSNDQGKVYLNGKEVVKDTMPRSLAKDQDQAKGVTLNKGTNVLVFKVINEQNNWQGCVRFTDKDGKPVKDLKLKLTP